MPKEWLYKQSKANTVQDLLHLLESGPIFYGALTPQEVQVADELEELDVVRRTFTGPLGMFGLSKVEIVK